MTVTRIVTIALLLVASFTIHPDVAQAGTGHENSCVPLNVGYDHPGGFMTIVCSSGSINMAILNGSSVAGACPTVDMDSLKILKDLALTARIYGASLTIWYTDACGANGSQTIRAITSIELKN
jgi:hypothetical protein